MLGQQLCIYHGSKQEYVCFKGLFHKQFKGELVLLCLGNSLLSSLLVPSRAVTKSLYMLVHSKQLSPNPKRLLQSDCVLD